MKLPVWLKGSLEPGTFLRPIGPHTYCLEVVEYSPPQFSQWRKAYSWKRTGAWDEGQYRCKRWGLKDEQPFDDGVHLHIGLHHLVNALPGVWREVVDGRDSPRYFRVIERQQRGQLDLFAAA